MDETYYVCAGILCPYAVYDQERHYRVAEFLYYEDALAYMSAMNERNVRQQENSLISYDYEMSFPFSRKAQVRELHRMMASK